MSKIKSYAAPQAGAELELYEYDAGELKAEDVEVQVDYCGICHSDLSMIDNEWGFSSYPLVAGHEVIGRVVALGSAAQDKGLKVGQRVGIGWTARSCGHCDACISGNQINCLEGAVPTILNKGGFADKLRADWQWVIPLPDSIDIESAGPLLCGGITVFKPLLMHHITATSRVGVIGIGGLGHIAIKLLHAMGCEVTAFSSNPAKEQEVLAMGADKVVNSRDPEALNALAGQFDLIINTVNVDLHWQPYFEALAYGGNLPTVGGVLKPRLPGPDIALNQLAARDKQVEMAFYLPIAQLLTAERLDALIRQYDPLSADTPPLDFRQVRGMLKGFIDLVFRHEGRYYLLDYKSNWLGEDREAYTRPAMEQAMRAHRYDLQYQLYSLALHRYLRHRLADYDYDRHFGGGIYLFLRGMDGQEGGQGIFTTRPVRPLIDGLDQLFAGETQEEAS